MTTTETKPRSVAETLRAARALIEDPDRWIKGAYARKTKRSRRPLNPTDELAGAWCALGALQRVDGPVQGLAESALARALSAGRSDWVHLIVTMNDARGTKHSDVLAAFDKAIAAAEVKP